MFYLVSILPIILISKLLTCRNLYSFITGGTTTDDIAAGAARTSSAPNVQDLQSTISPQLTTTGTEVDTQPEIPLDWEQCPHTSVKFMPESLPELVSSLGSEDEDFNQILMDDLEALQACVRKFVILPSPDLDRLCSIYKKTNFKTNQKWIGYFLNPAA